MTFEDRADPLHRLAQAYAEVPAEEGMAEIAAAVAAERQRR